MLKIGLPLMTLTSKVKINILFKQPSLVKLSVGPAHRLFLTFLVGIIGLN